MKVEITVLKCFMQTYKSIGGKRTYGSEKFYM